MPANIECPCGHTVRVPDGMLKTRIKCPVCGELLSAAAAQRESAFLDDVFLDDVEQPASSATGTLSAAENDSSIDDKKPTDQSQPQMTGRRSSNFNGMGAFFFLGLPMPAFCTESSLTLLPERVRLKSSGPLSTRRADLRLSEITSAETRRCPAWYLLLVGILLLPANGTGLILLIAFLFVRHSFLILKCGNATAAVRFKGDDTDACALGDAVLQAAR